MMPGTVGRGTRSGHWMMLAAIFVAAILLRAITLNAHGLWTDEALTIVLSNWPIIDMLLKPTDPTPLLYYAIHKLLISANSSIEAVRSISFVAGVTSVGLMYLVGRLAFGPAGGLLAAALLAVWSPHVDYSQEARAYSLLFLLTLLTSLGLLCYSHFSDRKPEVGKSNAGGRGFALALFGAGNVLSFYTHVASTFWIVLTCLLLLLVALRGRRIYVQELLIVFGVMVVCALPGIYRLIQQMLIGDEFHWLRQPSPFDAVAMSASVFLPIGLWDNQLTNAFGMTDAAKTVVATASIALLGAGFWFHRVWLRRSLQERSVVLWLVLAYLVVPVMVWLFGFVVRPVFIDRVILFCVPGMILLITAGCLALGRRMAVSVGIAVVLLYGASALLFGMVREKEDWRGAYRYLAASASPADVIAICPLYNYPALRYHVEAPVGVAVLSVTARGRLVKIEHGLGTDPEWDKTYFRHVLMPRMAGRPAAADSVRSVLRLQPGQSVWRIEGHCNPGFATDMDVALTGISPDADVAWIQKRKDPGTFGVVVRRYHLSAPVAFHVQDITPQPQDMGSFRGVSRLP
jgi:mannosyltransferase